MSTTNVRDYYNKIAGEYDSSRFDNSYGTFIDRQERQILDHQLKSKNVLNLGCGTGRFMEYCSTGLDFSTEMLEIAKKQYPDKKFHLSEAHTTPFENDHFDAVICFHVSMHLTPDTTLPIFREVNRILKPGGHFIFDYPSAERRKLTRYKGKGWHGNNAFSQRQMRELTATQNWKTTQRKGILFLPIHQIPVKLRSTLFGFDRLMTSGPAKNYSSYIVHSIQKPTT